MTYEQATAYTEKRPAFTAKRQVAVSTADELRAALRNLRAGDHVKATKAFTVSGETALANRLAGFAVVDLGTLVTFAYTGGADLPAVYVPDASYLRLYGGVLTTGKNGGPGILVHAAQEFLWWGFSIHDCGNTGFAAYPVSGPIEHMDVQGVITRCGLNRSWDPHAEKGSGLHAVNLWDSDNTNPFQDSRFAFDVTDQPSGAAVELGNGSPAPAMGNTLILRAHGLSYVSKSQTGGNGLQLWGDVSSLGIEIPYIEVGEAQGRAVDCEGVRTGQSAAGVHVAEGVASGTNLNAALDAGRLKGKPWDTLGGVQYGKVTQ